MSVITRRARAATSSARRRSRTSGARARASSGAYQSIAWFYAATTGQISIKHSMKGPCGVVVTEGAGGLEALQHSRRHDPARDRHVVSGGLEAPIGPYALVCQMTNGYLSTRARPGRGLPAVRRRARTATSRRGRRDPDGREPGQRAGAGRPQVYGEVVGYGATQDAYHHGQAGAGRAAARAGDAARARGRRQSDPRTSTWSSPTPPAFRRRTRSRPRDQGGLRRAGRDGAGHRAEDDDRPPLRGRRVARRGGCAARHARRRDPADDQPRPARGGLRPELRHRLRAGAPTSAPCWSTPAATAASTAPWCCGARA